MIAVGQPRSSNPVGKSKETQVGVRNATTDPFLRIAVYAENRRGEQFTRRGILLSDTPDPQWRSKAARTSEEAHRAKSWGISAPNWTTYPLIRVSLKVADINIYEAFVKKGITSSAKVGVRNAIADPYLRFEVPQQR